jgi:hypothetical protein
MTGGAPSSLPIATLNEGPLHAALKQWYAEEGDRFEVPLEGRQIDVVRGDLLIEIQTKSFASLQKKVRKLVEDHRVRLVHPVTAEKWIIRLDDDGDVLGRRRSPKRGGLHDVFEELVSVPALLANPNFSLDVLLIREEEVRQQRGVRRRKGWAIVERRLVRVVENHLFEQPMDLLRLLPESLPRPFTTADLAAQLGIARDLAQKMAYCLRKAGAVDEGDKRGNAKTYWIAVPV